MSKTRRFLGLIPALILAAALFTGTALADSGLYFRDKAIEFTVKPYLSKDTTMAPVETLVELMGISTFYITDSRALFCTDPGTGRTLAFIPDKLTAGTAGSVLGPYRDIEIPAPAAIISEEYCIPVRFFCEYFGFTVEWDAVTRGVNIYREGDPEDFGDSEADKEDSEAEGGEGDTAPKDGTENGVE